jgi:hypothetical protein
VAIPQNLIAAAQAAKAPAVDDGGHARQWTARIRAPKMPDQVSFPAA